MAHREEEDDIDEIDYLSEEDETEDDEIDYYCLTEYLKKITSINRDFFVKRKEFARSEICPERGGFIN